MRCLLVVVNGLSTQVINKPSALNVALSLHYYSCQQAVNKLSRGKIFFAQTNFLESTNQNTNVHTKIPKNRNRRKFSSGCQEAVRELAVRKLSGGCRAKIITILKPK